MTAEAGVVERRRVILDTDIGSDVDDLMALAVLLGSPEIDIVGISTVYSDTRIRAQLTQRFMSVAGRRVPVHAGEPATLSGRKVWWAGHEGALHADLDDEEYASDNAVQFLIDEVTTQPDQIDVIAIGPLTNIARAIQEDSDFAPAIRHLWIMGGAFGGDAPEHNFRSDTTSARIVLGAGIPTTVTGLDVTEQVRLTRAELDRIASAGDLGRILLAESRIWWEHKHEASNVPHDPLCALTLIAPELFAFSEPGEVRIEEGENEGVSRHRPGNGRTRVATNVNADAARAEIVERTVTAASRAKAVA